MYKRIIGSILVLTILVLSTGCSSNIIEEGNNESYNQVVAAIDQITVPFSSGGVDTLNGEKLSKFAQKFKNSNDKERSRLALEMADDMAIAEFYGIINAEMMVMAGAAVKAYPHPLLLNNYGAMVLDAVGAEDALLLFQMAAAQAAENPVILTNLANIFMELDDFSSAEQYANQALAATNDFGPAYQVLTTIHLKNNNSILAAETMVKSAKHCFNDITQYHFDSFLYAVAELDPEKDEYPLKEEFLKELYDIAKENVDTLDNGKGSDTLGAQLKLRPFPQITGPENLMKSEAYLDEEFGKIGAARSAAEKRRSAYGNADDSFYDMGNPREGTYPVIKNMRQIYAMKVMTSFYTYKLQQLKVKYNQEFDTSYGKRNEELDKLDAIYDEKVVQAEKEMEEAEADFWVDLISALDGGKLPDVDKLQQTVIVKPTLGVLKQREELQSYKMNANDIIDISQNYYDEMKQILEEYWLKTGGLLKYIIDEDAFYDLSIGREVFIYENVVQPLWELESLAGTLNSEQENLYNAERMLQVLLDAFLANKKEMDAAKAEEEKENKEAFNGGEIVPDIEKEALSTYPEIGDHGTLGVEADLFGVVGASAQYNGENVSLGVDSIAGSVGGSYNTFDGSTNASAVHGVTAIGSTDWFKDTKAVTKALANTGSLGKATSALGKIGFGFSGGKKTGEYAEMDSNKKITDRGSVYVRESGGSVSLFGRSEKIEVRKSYITGVAIKTKTTKYKFMFATYETNSN